VCAQAPPLPPPPTHTPAAAVHPTTRECSCVTAQHPAAKFLKSQKILILYSRFDRELTFQNFYLGVARGAQYMHDLPTTANTATHYNTLQHTAPHYITLHHAVPRCTTLHHAAHRCTTLHHAAPHRTTPHHATPRCTTLQRTLGPPVVPDVYTMYQTLQHSTPHCNTLEHTTTRCPTLPHAATRRNTLQRTATHPGVACGARRVHHIQNT